MRRQVQRIETLALRADVDAVDAVPALAHHDRFGHHEQRILRDDLEPQLGVVGGAALQAAHHGKAPPGVRFAQQADHRAQLQLRGLLRRRNDPAAGFARVVNAPALPIRMQVAQDVLLFGLGRRGASARNQLGCIVVRVVIGIVRLPGPRLAHEDRHLRPIGRDENGLLRGLTLAAPRLRFGTGQPQLLEPLDERELVFQLADFRLAARLRDLLGNRGLRFGQPVAHGRDIEVQDRFAGLLGSRSRQSFGEAEVELPDQFAFDRRRDQMQCRHPVAQPDRREIDLQDRKVAGVDTLHQQKMHVLLLRRAIFGRRRVRYQREGGVGHACFERSLVRFMQEFPFGRDPLLIAEQALLCLDAAVVEQPGKGPVEQPLVLASVRLLADRDVDLLVGIGEPAGQIVARMPQLLPNIIGKRRQPVLDLQLAQRTERHPVQREQCLDAPRRYRRGPRAQFFQKPGHRQHQTHRVVAWQLVRPRCYRLGARERVALFSSGLKQLKKRLGHMPSVLNSSGKMVRLRIASSR